jgi:hypothetical protein
VKEGVQGGQTNLDHLPAVSDRPRSKGCPVGNFGRISGLGGGIGGLLLAGPLASVCSTLLLKRPEGGSPAEGP